MLVQGGWINRKHGTESVSNLWRKLFADSDAADVIKPIMNISQKATQRARYTTLMKQLTFKNVATEALYIKKEWSSLGNKMN